MKEHRVQERFEKWFERLVWASASLRQHVAYRLRHFPRLMLGLCSSPLWSIRYQLYMAEFPHSDVLKIIQTFLCWNWNINISATACLLKGWKVDAALCSASVSFSSPPKWEAHSAVCAPALVISSPLLDSHYQISSADSLLVSALLFLLRFDFFFFFFHVHFQFP